MTQAAAEIAAETRRMRGRKPKAPQYYKFNAALNVRPPYFKLANEARLQECGSLLAELGWPDGYARLPRHPWRLPDYREPPLLLFDKKFGRPARDVENQDGLWFVTSAMKAFLGRVDPGACEFRKCDTVWSSGEAGPEYWLCSVTRLLFGWDVIDLEKSKNMTVVIRPDGFPSYPVTGGYPFIHLKSDAVGSAHLFRIVGLGEAIFCDQTLKDAYKEAGIKGGDFLKIGVDHW
ncbi:DUF1629 domain-containing protein [Methylocystis sp. SB2]|uniref:imm11 family protein n=1 Tax=Methylocystis sp. (strain SB2) TaxID=743836 RepID=UPI00040C40DD|nr:DUF1629 domain-containing protein [Methylocystis sp. SB2]ULO25002.1 DUF1629 domain-containing protein [Methylocystis sp. SB2]